MSDYEPPEAREVERAYRSAHRALEGIALPRDSFVPEKDLTISEVFSQFPYMVKKAEVAVAEQLGPLTSWHAPRPNEGRLELVVADADLDNNGTYDFDTVTLGEESFEGPDGDWQGSALNHAAFAYKRTAGWDFTPGESGIWLVMLAPMSGIGGEDDLWHYTGHLAGFVILYDRDNDGQYESVGHIWTASAWRHKGIARRLLTEAKARFQFTSVEEPYTEDGAAFLSACRDITQL